MGALAHLDLGDMDELLGLTGEVVVPALAPKSAPAVQRIRQSHHLLARKLAEGASNEEAAALTGYAPGTISKLKSDPSFQDLLTYYQDQVDTLKDDFQERLGAYAMSFADELMHRLEHAPETFSVEALRKLFETFGDRSVAPSKGSKGAAGVTVPAVAVKVEFVSAKPLSNLPPVIEASAE